MNNSSKEWSIYKVRFPYYNSKTNRIDYKSRPFLIIKEADDKFPKDYNALPVSKITDRSRRHVKYDVAINKNDYPNLNLTQPISFIRIHKMQTVNEKDLYAEIVTDIEAEYPTLVANIKLLIEEYYTNFK